MLKRIAAIIAILCVRQWRGPFWGPLFFTGLITRRSGLSGRVASTWGAPQGQAPLRLRANGRKEKTVEVEEKGKKNHAHGETDALGGGED